MIGFRIREIKRRDRDKVTIRYSVTNLSGKTQYAFKHTREEAEAFIRDYENIEGTIKFFFSKLVPTDPPKVEEQDEQRTCKDTITNRWYINECGTDSSSDMYSFLLDEQ